MTVKNVEKLEKSRVAVTVEVGAEEFEAAVAKAYAKARGKLSIPGFRPGKAPRKMIEKLYGAGNGDKKLAYAEEILREHGIRLDTATLKAMIDAQIKEMENMEPFYLADGKVEMIDNPKPETA